MNLHIKSILAALAFSLLFYGKSFGLNAFIISIIVGVLLATHSEKQPIPWLFLSAFILCGFMVFVTPNTLTILAYTTSFLVLIGKSIAHKSSTYIAGLLGVVSISGKNSHSEPLKTDESEHSKLSTQNRFHCG